MWEVELEPRMCPCICTLAHIRQSIAQQMVKGSDPSHLLSTGEPTHGVLCPVLGSSTGQTWTYWRVQKI